MILKLDPDELLPIRVQYLPDTDPYNSMAMYPVPSRAPTYSFVCSTPLATQLGAILRLLGAPQRVRHTFLYIKIFVHVIGNITHDCIIYDVKYKYMYIVYIFFTFDFESSYYGRFQCFDFTKE